jgi:hypothetical protein
MTRHKHADVLIAIAEGREVEYKCSAHSAWETLDNPETGADPFYYPDWQWRVKPVPVKRYEWLQANLKVDNDYYFCYHEEPKRWHIKITFEDDAPVKMERNLCLP